MDLRNEYRSDQRTVGEEVIYKQITNCCGGCAGFFMGWAHLLASRSVVPRNPQWFLFKTLDEFKRHQEACQYQMEEGDRVNRLLNFFDANWQRDWRNPLSRDPEGLAQKFEAFRRLQEDRSSGM